jgi:hypothetical protein
VFSEEKHREQIAVLVLIEWRTGSWQNGVSPFLVGLTVGEQQRIGIADHL